MRGDARQRSHRTCGLALRNRAMYLHNGRTRFPGHTRPIVYIRSVLSQSNNSGHQLERKLFFGKSPGVEKKINNL